MTTMHGSAVWLDSCGLDRSCYQLLEKSDAFVSRVNSHGVHIPPHRERMTSRIHHKLKLQRVLA